MTEPMPADRVHVSQLIAIAIACACVGLGAVYGIADRMREVPLITTVSAASSPDMTADDGEPLAAAQTNANQPLAAAQMNASKTLAAISARSPAKPSASPAISLPMSPHARALAVKRSAYKPMRTHAFERGLVSYVRCDGLLRRKRQACPRDRRLEASVWSSLQSLPQCRAADPGSGQAELRLTIQHDGPFQIELGAVPGARSLNLRAVSRCMGAGMTKLRTRLRTKHGVVTFRFAVR